MQSKALRTRVSAADGLLSLIPKPGLRSMRGIFWTALSFLHVSVATGQPARLEIGRVTGECSPIYAATSQSLRLHKRPDLQAEQLTLRYQVGWEVPYRHGTMRVLRFGELRVLKPEPLGYCDTAPGDGVDRLIVGETVDYLYGLGEGSGQIRVRGGTCPALVAEDFGIFEVLSYPEVQIWLDVRFADGTSPGWLLLDSTQTRVAGSRC